MIRVNVKKKKEKKKGLPENITRNKNLKTPDPHPIRINKGTSDELLPGSPLIYSNMQLKRGS